MKTSMLFLAILLSCTACSEDYAIHQEDYKKAEYACSLHGGIDHAWEDVDYTWHVECANGFRIEGTTAARVSRR